MNDIKSEIRQFIIRENLRGERAENLKDDTRLVETGILDSLSTLTLILFIEKKYQIKVPWVDVTGDMMVDLNHIERYIESKRAKA